MLTKKQKIIIADLLENTFKYDIELMRNGKYTIAMTYAIPRSLLYSYKPLTDTWEKPDTWYAIEWTTNNSKEIFKIARRILKKFNARLVKTDKGRDYGIYLNEWDNN